MLGANHRRITKGALGALTLSSGALDLICVGNEDSDAFGKNGGYSFTEQHFCTTAPGTSATAIQKSLAFSRDAVDVAGGFVERGWSATDSATANDNFSKALYSFGRACHCVQDFYAHSNWVALGRSEVWHRNHFYGLFVCMSTKRNAILRNFPYLSGWNFDRAQEYVNLMKLTERDHPDIQLDYQHSAPSTALEFVGVTIGPGYDRAKELSVKHTRQTWDEFAALLARLIDRQPGFLQSKLLKDFRTYRPEKKDLDIPKLRKAFNWAMGY